MKVLNRILHVIATLNRRYRLLWWPSRRDGYFLDRFPSWTGQL